MHLQTCVIPFVLCDTFRISDYVSVIRRSFFLPKQSQRSRSVSQDGSRSLGLLRKDKQDGSRSLGLFRKGRIGIIAKFHRTDLVI